MLLSRDRSFRCLDLNLRAEINQSQSSNILVFECHFSSEILTGEKTEKSLENLSLTTMSQMAELVERATILGYYQVS